jgi:hypothetical protein
VGRKHKPPGEYILKDGRRQTVEDDGDKRIVTVYSKHDDKTPVDTHVRYHSEHRRHGGIAEMVAKHTPPATLRTVPGNKRHDNYDPQLHMNFGGRVERERYMLENNLVETDRHELCPPSDAELPRRPPGLSTHGMVTGAVFESDGSLSVDVEKTKQEAERVRKEWDGSYRQKKRKEALGRRREQRRLKNKLREQHG